jgi:hypothetical protein
VYLPVRLATDPPETTPAAGHIADTEACLYDSALYTALDRAGHRALYELPVIDVDEALGALASSALQEIGWYLVVEARGGLACAQAGFTRFHRIALCVADHLAARGDPIP